MERDIKQKLFNYFKNEHNIILFDSELNDIRHIVLGDKDYIDFCNWKLNKNNHETSLEEVDRITKTMEEK